MPEMKEKIAISIEVTRNMDSGMLKMSKVEWKFDEYDFHNVSKILSLLAEAIGQMGDEREIMGKQVNIYNTGKVEVITNTAHKMEAQFSLRFAKEDKCTE